MSFIGSDTLEELGIGLTELVALSLGNSGKGHRLIFVELSRATEKSILRTRMFTGKTYVETAFDRRLKITNVIRENHGVFVLN